MRILIAEDDFASRKAILKFLSAYGECDVTVDGMEAIDAFMMALEEEDPKISVISKENIMWTLLIRRELS